MSYKKWVQREKHPNDTHVYLMLKSLIASKNLSYLKEVEGARK